MTAYYSCLFASAIVPTESCDIDLTRKCVHWFVDIPTGHAIEDSRLFGWEVQDNVQHNWSTLVKGVQDHIGSLNWGYRTALRDKNVKYLNGLATFQDPHTIKVRSVYCTLFPYIYQYYKLY